MALPRRSLRNHAGSYARDIAIQRDAQNIQGAAPGAQEAAPEPAYEPMAARQQDGRMEGQFAQGIQALLQQQQEARTQERAVEAFNRSITNLKDDTPIRAWIEQVKRLRPEGLNGEDLWTTMCKKVPAEQYDITMNYFREAEGNGEDKLRAAFKEFAKAHGDESTEDSTWKELMSFKQKEYETPVRAILRFNSLYQAYATVCNEEDKEPRPKDSESIKTAFLEGLGLLMYVSDFTKSFADIEKQARQVIKNLATTRLNSDLQNASRHTSRRGKQEVLASEQVSMAESLKQTFRELRNELSKSVQDELQSAIPQIVASITEKTRADTGKRGPPKEESNAKRPRTRTHSPEPQTGPPCPNFRKGRCEGGRYCYYSHSDDRRRDGNHHRKDHRGRQQRECTFWRTGRCRKGNKCDFQHGPSRTASE